MHKYTKKYTEADIHKEVRKNYPIFQEFLSDNEIYITVIVYYNWPIEFIFSNRCINDLIRNRLKKSGSFLWNLKRNEVNGVGIFNVPIPTMHELVELLAGKQ